MDTNPQCAKFLESVGLHCLTKVDFSKNNRSLIQEFISNFNPASGSGHVTVTFGVRNKRKSLNINLMDTAFVGEALGLNSQGVVDMVDCHLCMDASEFFHPGAYKSKIGFRNTMAKEAWLGDVLRMLSKVVEMKGRSDVTSPYLLWLLQMARKGVEINWASILARNACRLLGEIYHKERKRHGKHPEAWAGLIISHLIEFAASRELQQLDTRRKMGQVEAILQMPQKGICSEELPRDVFCVELLPHEDEAEQQIAQKEARQTQDRQQMPQTEVQQQMLQTEVQQQMPETEGQQQMPETEGQQQMPQIEVQQVPQKDVQQMQMPQKEAPPQMPEQGICGEAAAEEVPTTPDPKSQGKFAFDLSEGNIGSFMMSLGSQVRMMESSRVAREETLKKEIESLKMTLELERESRACERNAINADKAEKEALVAELSDKVAGLQDSLNKFAGLINETARLAANHVNKIAILTGSHLTPN